MLKHTLPGKAKFRIDLWDLEIENIYFQLANLIPVKDGQSVLRSVDKLAYTECYIINSSKVYNTIFGTKYAERNV